MKFKLFIQVIVFLTLVFTFKQAKSEEVTNKSFQYYDSITYQQYLAGDWNNLILNAKQALAVGYDYKYLRLRMGFAYYFKNNFRTAADHFLKALHFDSYDTIAALYFNLSCQAAGRSGEFYSIEGSPKPYRMLDFIYADAGVMLPGKVNDSAVITDSTTYYIELINPVSRSFQSVGIKLRPLPDLSFFLSFSKIDLTDKKSFGYLSQVAVRDSIVGLQYENDYFYSYPIKTNYAEQEFSNQQLSYYLGLTYFPVAGLKITPSVHYLHIKAQKVSAEQTITATTDTAWYNKFDNTWHTFNYNAYDYTITTTDTSYFDHVYSLSVAKDLGKFSLELRGSYSRILEKKISQIGASICWYPMGNTNLYAVSSFSYLNDQTTTSKVFEQTIGGRFYKYGWIEGFAMLGELKNYNEKNAYIVYNLIYPVSMRLGATIYPYIGRHFELMLMYRYQKMGLFLTTITPKQSTTETQTTVTNPDYNYSSLTAGVKWKF
jgi:hypothetical protein